MYVWRRTKIALRKFKRTMMMTVEYAIANAGKNINRPLRITEKSGRGKKQWKLTNCSNSQENMEKLNEYEVNKETKICDKIS
jgi:hypothetical protein